MRRIFLRLMWLQSMKGGTDKYGVPYSNQQEVVTELLDMTTDWLSTPPSALKSAHAL